MLTKLIHYNSRIILTLIVVFLFTFSVNAQLSQRFIGTASRNEFALDTKVIPNNGVIICGYSFLPSGSGDAIITRVDNSGNLMWQKQVSTPNEDRFLGVTKTFDGGFVAVGYINSLSAYVNNTAIAIKYDALGNVVWTKTFNQTTQGEVFFDVVEMPITHNIVAVGATSFAPGSADTWVVVLDNITGSVKWQRNFSTGSTDYALAVNARSSDILIGGAYVGNTYADLCFISINENTGMVNWSKSYDYNSTLYTGNSNGILNIETFGDKIYLNTQIAEQYLPAVFLTDCIIVLDTLGNNPYAFEFGKQNKPFCVLSTLKVIDSNTIYSIQNVSNIYFNPYINTTGSNYSANTVISKLKKIVPSQNALYKTKELISNGNTSFFGLDVSSSYLGAVGYTSGGAGQIGNLDINYLKADTSLNATNSCGFSDTVMNVGYPIISIGSYPVTNTVTNIGANDVHTFSNPILVDSIYCGIDTILPPPNKSKIDANFNFQFSYCTGIYQFIDSSIDEKNSIVAYYWNFGDPNSGAENISTIANPSHKFSAEGAYTITLIATNADGNKDTVFKTINNSNPKSESLYIPNIFSPNRDGLNDCFTPISKSNFVNYSLKIYNRWGELVYFSNNANDCWDGQQKNGQIEIGTYFYILNAKTECSSIDWKGDITLIK